MMAQTTSPKFLISAISLAPSFLLSLQLLDYFDYFIKPISQFVIVLIFATILYFPPSKNNNKNQISLKNFLNISIIAFISIFSNY